MLFKEMDIRKLATDETAYINGCQLAQIGAVQTFQYNQALNAYYALVYENGQKYEVIIYLDNVKQIHRFQCGCMDYRNKKTACRHIIATLKAIESSNQQDHLMQLSNNIAIENILAIPDETVQSDMDKIMIHAEMMIASDDIKKNPLNNYYMQFKIGLTKQYILKDYSELFEAINKSEDLYYGKDFTFSPDLHTFEPAFYKTLDYLKKIHEIDERCNAHFFEGKKIYLTNYQFKEILSYWLGKNIQFLDRTVEVSDDTFPDYIDLRLQAGSIVVDVSQLKNIIAMFDDDTILVDQHILYMVDSSTAHKLHPFLDACRMGLNEIYFENNKKTSFIEQVIPQLEKVKTIPEPIQNLYRHGRLRAHLYLDRNDTIISARPEFTYGNYSFNPFSKVDIPFDQGRQVLRDLKREQKIMRILEKAEFMVTPTHLYLDDDEKIRRFIFEYLPHLEHIAEIFYSDTFKDIVKKRSLKSNIRLNQQINFFEVDFDIDNITYPEFRKILESYHLKRHYYRLKDGSFLALDDAETIKTLQMAEDLNIDKDSFQKGHLMLPLNRAFYFNDHFQNQLSKDEAFHNFMRQFSSSVPDLIEIPKNLNGTLRDYQIIGYHWLKTLAYYHLGGILADDMGLGKTLQTITYILDFQNFQKGIHLIISPTSLVFNWEDEIMRFAPDLKVLVISGHQNERLEKIKTAQQYDVVLTSYPLLRRDIEAYDEIIFDTCILDEAQYIKNASSLNAQATKKIHAKVHFALTGTPIENSLEELWSIFDFILPNYFSNHHYFRNKYEIPILKEQDEMVSQRLQKQIQPFILRRMKKDVLTELPDKIETKIPVKMTPKQSEVYYSYLKESRWTIDQSIQNLGIDKARFEILSRLTHLRQLCNHPRLFLEDYDGQSAKLNVLIELIREAIEGGHRLLVFSQFTSMLKIIQEELNHIELDYLYLDGQTKMDDRTQLVKQFNQGKTNIFLISLKAGGTGLNLVSADMVIHVDPWWNPAVEEQATDRAHRIGQNNTVQVIKLITAHSIEEKIYELQKRKKGLTEAIIQPGENFLTHLSENEIYDLFNADYQ